jgi:hypothetical protein
MSNKKMAARQLCYTAGMNYEVGTYVDLHYLNKKPEVVATNAKAPKVVKTNFMAIALDNEGTRFSFKPARSIPVVFA